MMVETCLEEQVVLRGCLFAMLAQCIVLQRDQCHLLRRNVNIITFTGKERIIQNMSIKFNEEFTCKACASACTPASSNSLARQKLSD